MSREIVADPRKLLLRFGDEPPERFYYRGELLSQESENLIGRGKNIFENGGTSTQRKVQYLRSLGDVPEGGRPSVVREFQRDSECIEDFGGELSFLRSGRHRLGMRTLGCVRPRDAALTLAMETHFSKCENRLAFCHVCTGYFSAMTGLVENVGVLGRAQVSTRRIVVREGRLDWKVQSRDRTQMVAGVREFELKTLWYFSWLRNGSAGPILDWKKPFSLKTDFTEMKWSLIVSLQICFFFLLSGRFFVYRNLNFFLFKFSFCRKKVEVTVRIFELKARLEGKFF